MKSRFNKFAYVLGIIGIIVGGICLLDSNVNGRVCLSSVFCGVCMIIIARLNAK